MSKGHWRVDASTRQLDCERSVADDVDRLDEPTHVRQELGAGAVAVQLARTSAAVTGVPSEKRASSRNVTIQMRPSSVEPPGRGQAWTDTAHAVDPDQRLIELTEEQSLAVVRRPGCIRRIDAVTEADGRNRFSGRGDQRALVGDGLTARALCACGNDGGSGVTAAVLSGSVG